MYSFLFHLYNLQFCNVIDQISTPYFIFRDISTYKIWRRPFFHVGGEPALREGAHGDTGVPAWLTLPPLGSQSIICAAPEERRRHGNDLEWSSQGLQLRDWWWAGGRRSGTQVYQRGEKRHTGVGAVTRIAGRWVWAIWQLHCGGCQSRPALTFPGDSALGNLAAARSAQLKGQFLRQGASVSDCPVPTALV